VGVSLEALAVSLLTGWPETPVSQWLGRLPHEGREEVRDGILHR
jgi:hypothetical protein